MINDWLNEESLIKEFEEYVNSFQCTCTTDEYNLEMLKTVLEFIKTNKERTNYDK